MAGVPPTKTQGSPGLVDSGKTLAAQVCVDG